mmetsp:Transcript_8615/g.23484  ORF Transcript_8615/g.23484 Transcript_8615/m.23484 type:complete len:242 (-) Transcript_8615:38-763(-)
MALLHEMCLLHGILVSRLLQLLGTSQSRTSRMFPPSRPLLFDVFALLLRQLLLPSVLILSRRCGGLVVLGAVIKLGIVSVLVVGLVDTFRIFLLAVIARQDGLGIIAKIRRQEHGRQLRDTLRGGVCFFVAALAANLLDSSIPPLISSFFSAVSQHCSAAMKAFVAQLSLSSSSSRSEHQFCVATVSSSRCSGPPRVLSLGTCQADCGQCPTHGDNTHAVTPTIRADTSHKSSPRCATLWC